MGVLRLSTYSAACCRYGLTGTAMQNEHKELWALLDWAAPGALGDWKEFKTQFADPLQHAQKATATDDELALVSCQPVPASPLRLRRLRPVPRFRLVIQLAHDLGAYQCCRVLPRPVDSCGQGLLGVLCQMPTELDVQQVESDFLPNGWHQDRSKVPAPYHEQPLV